MLFEIPLQPSATDPQTLGKCFLGYTVCDCLIVEGLQPFGKLHPELLVFLGSFHKKTLDGYS